MEQRKSQRIRVSLPARYRSRAVSLDGVVADLSCDGLFLKAEFLDDTGTAVDVDVDLPGADAPVSLAGEVVRTDDTPAGRGMGIRFRNLALPTRLLIANYLLARSSSGR